MKLHLEFDVNETQAVAIVQVNSIWSSLEIDDSEWFVGSDAYMEVLLGVRNFFRGLEYVFNLFHPDINILQEIAHSDPRLAKSMIAEFTGMAKRLSVQQERVSDE